MNELFTAINMFWLPVLCFLYAAALIIFPVTVGLLNIVLSYVMEEDAPKLNAHTLWDTIAGPGTWAYRKDYEPLVVFGPVVVLVFTLMFISLPKEPIYLPLTTVMWAGMLWSVLFSLRLMFRATRKVTAFKQALDQHAADPDAHKQGGPTNA